MGRSSGVETWSDTGDSRSRTGPVRRPIVQPVSRPNLCWHATCKSATCTCPPVQILQSPETQYVPAPRRARSKLVSPQPAAPICPALRHSPAETTRSPACPLPRCFHRPNSPWLCPSSPSRQLQLHSSTAALPLQTPRTPRARSGPTASARAPARTRQNCHSGLEPAAGRGTGARARGGWRCSRVGCEWMGGCRRVSEMELCRRMRWRGRV